MVASCRLPLGIPSRNFGISIYSRGPRRIPRIRRTRFRFAVHRFRIEGPRLGDDQLSALDAAVEAGMIAFMARSGTELLGHNQYGFRVAVHTHVTDAERVTRAFTFHPELVARAAEK